MKWAFLRRLYVKTPARNYTLFQNIFVVEIFFDSKITQMLTDELLTFFEKSSIQRIRYNVYCLENVLILTENAGKHYFRKYIS